LSGAFLWAAAQKPKAAGPGELQRIVKPPALKASPSSPAGFCDSVDKLALGAARAFSPAVMQGIHNRRTSGNLAGFEHRALTDFQPSTAARSSELISLL
jgi:hypothetical protein